MKSVPGSITKIRWFILYETYKEVIIKMDPHRRQILFDYWNEHVFGHKPRNTQPSEVEAGPQDDSIMDALHAINEASLASINDDEEELGGDNEADEQADDGNILGDLASGASHSRQASAP